MQRQDRRRGISPLTELLSSNITSEPAASRPAIRGIEALAHIVRTLHRPAHTQRYSLANVAQQLSLCTLPPPPPLTHQPSSADYTPAPPSPCLPPRAFTSSRCAISNGPRTTSPHTFTASSSDAPARSSSSQSLQLGDTWARSLFPRSLSHTRFLRARGQGRLGSMTSEQCVEREEGGG